MTIANAPMRLMRAGTGASRAPSADVSGAPFLAPAEGDDDPRDFLTPPRDGCTVEPLIEASQAYPAIEDLILDAKATVHLAFRILDPEFRTVGKRAREAGIADWGSLLVHAARNGARVRLLLTDFDPVAANPMHRVSWEAYLAIADRLDGESEETRARLEVVLPWHEGEIGHALRYVFWPFTHLRLRRVLSEMDQISEETLRRVPGLRPYLLKSGDGVRAKLWPPTRLWPVTHHQKLAIIDASVAVLGGLDIDQRRLDDPDHSRDAPDTWHDVSCRISGPVIADCERHFHSLWNIEAARFRETLDELTELGGKAPPLVRPQPFSREQATPETTAADTPPGDFGPVRMQVLRTISRKRGSAFTFGPRPVRRDLEAAHHEAIRRAERLIYIENQFFRLRSISRALYRRLAEKPDLQVIILLPMAPEEIAYEDYEGPDARHGEYLQVRALQLLLKHGRGRVGIFSLVQNDAEPPAGRATAYGSGIIYLHSKVVIVDDEIAMVSSANINGRSFRWDTEIGILWQGGDSVHAFRERLWNAHLGEAARDVTGNLERWRAIAERNVALGPAERQGFIVPYKLGAARRFAKPQLFVPDDLV